MISIICFFGYSVYDLIYYTSTISTNDYIQKQIEDEVNALLSEQKNGFLIVENLNNINRIYGKIKFDYMTNILTINEYNIDVSDKEKMYTLFI